MDSMNVFGSRNWLEFPSLTRERKARGFNATYSIVLQCIDASLHDAFPNCSLRKFGFGTLNTKFFHTLTGGWLLHDSISPPLKFFTHNSLSSWLNRKRGKDASSHSVGKCILVPPRYTTIWWQSVVRKRNKKCKNRDRENWCQLLYS